MSADAAGPLYVERPDEPRMLTAIGLAAHRSALRCLSRATSLEIAPHRRQRTSLSAEFSGCPTTRIRWLPHLGHRCVDEGPGNADSRNTTIGMSIRSSRQVPRSRRPDCAPVRLLRSSACPVFDPAGFTLRHVLATCLAPLRRGRAPALCRCRWPAALSECTARGHGRHVNG